MRVRSRRCARGAPALSRALQGSRVLSGVCERSPKLPAGLSRILLGSPRPSRAVRSFPEFSRAFQSSPELS
eukprot:11736702-Alexandrium_andersonii.AAC.1